MQRLVWVSNIPSPYKASVFRALNESVALADVYLAGSEPGRHWRTTGTVLRTLKCPLGESFTYLLIDRVPRLAEAEAVFLPGWENPASWQLLRRARRAGTAAVGFYESTQASHSYRTGPVSWVRQRFFQSVDAVLTSGQAATDALLAMGVPQDRIVTGFNAVDVQAFSSAATRLRAAHGPHDGHHFLYVGQLITRKNVEAALRAFAHVAADRDRLFVVGDGPLRQELEVVARELGVGNKVDFRGHLQNEALFAAYAGADTLVLPSLEEVWGFVINEALASGLHVVVSEVAGVVPSVRHMTGVFVAAPTVEELSAQLRASKAAWKGPVQEPEMLRHTPEKAAQYALQAVSVARARVASRGAAEHEADRVLWLTNIVTPYRAPLWDALQGMVPLTVACLARTEANRGWSLPTGSTLDVRYVDALSYGGKPLRTPLYAPSVRLARMLKRTRPDVLVVDGWESPAFLQACRAARAQGTAVVASYRSTELTHSYVNGPVAWARRRFFQQADAVFTAGPASTRAVAAMGVDPTRIVTGFNAVDVLAFAEATARVREAGTDRQGHTFLFVGQLIGRKNLRSALLAFSRIAGEHDRFQVVGTGDNLTGLQVLVSKLGLQDRVAFLGDRQGDDLYEAYGSSDTLVLPSTEEVWGLVANEALASGLHVVVSVRAGVVPSIREMRGVFVAEPSEESLAQQMAASRSAWDGPVPDPEMLQHTPEGTAEAVQRALQIARQNRDARLSRS